MLKSEREEMVARIVEWSIFACTDPRKPGAALKKLLGRYGDKIRQLTSDDFKDVRAYRRVNV
jgi:hypothetical protein